MRKVAQVNGSGDVQGFVILQSWFLADQEGAEQKIEEDGKTL
jgi:hypothetical protein